MVGPYRVDDMIGEGGMCAVYRGTHSLLERHVAIKVLLAEHARDPQIVKRFFNEARAITKLADPGIVQVFDYGHHSDGAAYMVMELLAGEPMSRRLARGERFGLIEFVRIAQQMCSSLGAAHAKGVIHRDLKPDNIFLVSDPAVPGGTRAKILDFGIAKVTFAEQSHLKTRTDTVIGTPTYMSPEQCRGGGDIDHRSDIYALGCVMFAMLTGHPPFRSQRPGDVIASHLKEPAPRVSSRLEGVPALIDGVLECCLAKAPATRFQSMQDLGGLLGALEHSLATARPQVGRWLADLVTLRDSRTSPGASQGKTLELRAERDAEREAPSIVIVANSTQSMTTLNGANGQTDASPLLGPAMGRRWGAAATACVIVGAVAVAAVLWARRTPHGAASAASAPPAEAARARQPTRDAGDLDAVAVTAERAARGAEEQGSAQDEEISDIEPLEPAAPRAPLLGRRRRASGPGPAPADPRGSAAAPPQIEQGVGKRGQAKEPKSQGIELDENGLPVRR